jgi:parallel beta-helix repeat protein
MKRRKPAAFMSYVRFDDQHDDGQLTRFRERLSAEVQAQTGEEFPIFQDRNDIAWGQNWRARIEESLDTVTLLIPIITPSFFLSPACRDELTCFLDREHDLGRQDLILSVYYISTPKLDDVKRRRADRLAKVLATRQYADWRELRFEPFTSPLVRKALAQLASRMRDTFWQEQPTQAARPSQSRRAATQTAGSKGTAGEPVIANRPSAKTEPPTRVVDAVPGRGDHTTISAAIMAAQPGDRILVRPGRYQEGLVVDKPLEILGDGPVADIEVQARSADALWFKANIGRVANLTLRQAGGEGEWCGVDIAQGRLELEGCDISSESLADVVIRDGADPRLRRNKIHGGEGQGGVLIYNNGLGTLEDNEITESSTSGVEIRRGGNPSLRRNQIHDNTEDGVYVHENGLGTLEDNDITANGYGGVEIMTGGNPTLRGNRINHNKSHGIIVHQGGRGVIEDNDLTDNRIGPWDIAKDCEPNVKRSGNRE